MTDVPLPEDVPEPTREQVVEAAIHAATHERLRLLLLDLRLLQELHPDEIRGFLNYSYDATACEERLKQVAHVANHAELKLADVVATTGWLERTAGPLLEEAVRQSERLTALEEKVGRALAYVKKVVIELQAKGALRKPQPQRSKT